MIFLLVSFLVVVAAVVTLLVVAARPSVRPWVRWASGAVAVTVTGLIGFLVWSVDNPELEQREIDAPIIAGLRVDGDDLSIWPGERCEGLRYVSILVSADDPRRLVELRFEGSEPGGISVRSRPSSCRMIRRRDWRWLSGGPRRWTSASSRRSP